MRAAQRKVAGTAGTAFLRSFEQAAANVVIAAEALLDLRDGDLGHHGATVGTAGPVIGIVEGGEKSARLGVREIIVRADAGVAGGPREQGVFEMRRGLALAV